MEKEEVDFLGRLLYNKNYDTPEKKIRYGDPFITDMDALFI